MISFTEWVGTARLVLLGEATHGTNEFYRERAEITKRLSGSNDAALWLPQTLLERAIGVIYLPQTERLSHYFQARLAAQFDAVLHFDVTRAVEPLDRTSGWDAGELPDTFPTGI